MEFKYTNIPDWHVKPKILSWNYIQKFLSSNVHDYLIFMCLNSHISA